MENGFDFDTTERLLIGIVSERAGIALSVIESLLSNFCRVNIYSINPENWKSGLEHLKDNANVVVNPLEKLGQNGEGLFGFFSLVFSNYNDFGKGNKFLLEKTRIESLRNVIGGGVRTFYFLPYVYGLGEDPGIQKEYQFVFSKLKAWERVVFLGQLVGKRMTLTDRDPLSEIFKDALVKGHVYYPRETYFYPVTIDGAAKYIVRLILSFNIENRKISILGPRIKAKNFAGVLKRVLRKRKEIVIGEKEQETFLLADTKDSKIVNSLREVEAAVRDVAYWQKTKKDYIEQTDSVVKRKKEGKGILEIIKNKRDNKDKNKNKNRNKNKEKGREVKVKAIVGRNIKRGMMAIGKNVFSFKRKGVFRRRGVGKFPKMGRRLKVGAGKSRKVKLSLVYLFLIFFIVLLPFLLTGASVGVLLCLEKRISKEDYSGAKKIVLIADRVGRFSTELNNIYLMTPYVGRVYLRSKQVSNLVSVASDTVINTLEIAERASDLLTGVLGSEDVDVGEYIEPISLDLDNLYRKLGFLQNEMEGLPQPLLKYFGGYLSPENFEKARKNVLLAKGLSSKLDDVFAVGSKKKYLILFQNNMELRPTGGFIGSFALVDFQNGKFLGFDVYDVYSADGQLKGYVKPPEPIEKYMKQAVWYLRDANWDPDFPVSAKRIEWFLDKEMNVSVDGVIAVDLNLIKGILDVIGPIYLPSFDKEINSSNLYDVTQFEVENDFFPGSRKKANFLTDMAKVIVLDLKSAEREKYMDLIKVAYRNLQERHIQLYFHSGVDKEVQGMGWGGSVERPVCEGENCFSDVVGIVEANLGVNKANYFVKRSLNLNVLVSGDVIKRELSLVLDDNANPALGSGGRYRVYVRLIAPKGAVFDAVEISGSDGGLFVDPDMEESGDFVKAGVFVELNPKEKKEIKYVWQTKTDLNFKRNGSYNLLLRKQAGVDGYDIGLGVVFPLNLRVRVKPKLLLTDGGDFKYNAYLTQDLEEGFYW